MVTRRPCKLYPKQRLFVRASDGGPSETEWRQKAIAFERRGNAAQR